MQIQQQRLLWEICSFFSLAMLVLLYDVISCDVINFNFFEVLLLNSGYAPVNNPSKLHVADLAFSAKFSN